MNFVKWRSNSNSNQWNWHEKEHLVNSKEVWWTLWSEEVIVITINEIDTSNEHLDNSKDSDEICGLKK